MVEGLLEGGMDVLRKTDCLPHLSTPSNKSALYYYNQLSYLFVAKNYANWASGQPAKDLVGRDIPNCRP